MRHSIRRQFSLIFIALMAGTIFLCWVMNSVFLEQVYIHSKTNIILEAYQSIRQAANSDTYSTEKFRQELDEVCGVYNITIYVMDVYSEVKYASVNGGAELEKQLMSYLFGFFPDTVKVLRAGDEYQVQRVRTEEDEYLEMYGRLTSGILTVLWRISEWWLR